MRFFVVCAALLLSALSTHATAQTYTGDKTVYTSVDPAASGAYQPPPVASTNTQSDWVKFDPIVAPWNCTGKCAVTLFAGPLLRTGEGQVLGVDGYVPPWRYRFGDSAFVGGTLSQVLVEFGDYADLEGEIGVGQRFGFLHETEGWVALYGRWKWFPWNNYITTTVAVSTGLDYASGIPPYEVQLSSVGHGSNLLHYFSPEITFAKPDRPDWQLVIRLHHRSGGGQYWGYTPIFKGVGGGAQYLVFGIRHWF